MEDNTYRLMSGETVPVDWESDELPPEVRQDWLQRCFGPTGRPSIDAEGERLLDEFTQDMLRAIFREGPDIPNESP